MREKGVKVTFYTSNRLFSYTFKKDSVEDFLAKLRLRDISSPLHVDITQYLVEGTFTGKKVCLFPGQLVFLVVKEGV